jgi:hypothetical protein
MMRDLALERVEPEFELSVGKRAQAASLRAGELPAVDREVIRQGDATPYVQPGPGSTSPVLPSG